MTTKGKRARRAGRMDGRPEIVNLYYRNSCIAQFSPHRCQLRSGVRCRRVMSLLDKVCTWKSGAAVPGCATFARSYITRLWEWRPRKEFTSRNAPHSLPPRSREVSFRREYHVPARDKVWSTTCGCSRGSPGSLFSDNTTLDKLLWKSVNIIIRGL